MSRGPLGAPRPFGLGPLTKRQEKPDPDSAMAEDILTNLVADHDVPRPDIRILPEKATATFRGEPPTIRLPLVLVVAAETFGGRWEDHLRSSIAHEFTHHLQWLEGGKPDMREAKERDEEAKAFAADYSGLSREQKEAQFAELEQARDEIVQVADQPRGLIPKAVFEEHIREVLEP